MVSYQTWTDIAFEVAERKGARFEGLADGGTFVGDVVAPLWNQNKQELSTATMAEARQLAERRIEA